MLKVLADGSGNGFTFASGMERQRGSDDCLHPGSLASTPGLISSPCQPFMATLLRHHPLSMKCPAENCSYLPLSKTLYPELKQKKPVTEVRVHLYLSAVLLTRLNKKEWTKETHFPHCLSTTLGAESSKKTQFPTTVTREELADPQQWGICRTC